MPEFLVTLRIDGSMTIPVSAESAEAAEKKITDKIEEDVFDPDLDTWDCSDILVQQLHPVIRDGQRIKTTYVKSTDTRL